MAFSATHRIIWLDAFIGKEGECIAFKRHFTHNIDPLARVDDELDRCIQDLNENAAPFVFVHNDDQAMDALQNSHQYRVIFISSGSLGERVVRPIRRDYPQVYSFYIFCGDMGRYIDLVIENADVLKIFDHEIDLLIRLMRDLSKEMIDRGQSYLVENKPSHAVDCFQRARNLEEAANKEDKLNSPIYERLHILGNENNPGLIQQAENIILQAIGQPDQQQAQPFVNETVGVELGQEPEAAPMNVGVPPDGENDLYGDMPQDSPSPEEAT